MLGRSTDINTIIGFTVDQSDQVMVIFTSDEISTPIEELKIYQDYLINIADKEDNVDTKMLNDITVEVSDEKTFNAVMANYGDIVTELGKAGKIW